MRNIASKPRGAVTPNGMVALSDGASSEISSLMRNVASKPRGAVPPNGAVALSDGASGEISSSVSHELDMNTASTSAHRVADVEEVMKLEVDAGSAVDGRTAPRLNHMMRNVIGKPRGAASMDGNPSSEVGSLMSRGFESNTVVGFAERLKTAFGVTYILIMVAIVVAVFLASLAGFIIWQSSASNVAEGLPYSPVQRVSSWRGKQSFFGEYKRTDRKATEADLSRNRSTSPSQDPTVNTKVDLDRNRSASPSPDPTVNTEADCPRKSPRIMTAGCLSPDPTVNTEADCVRKSPRGRTVGFKP
jgi:hypothetical protein